MPDVAVLFKSDSTAFVENGVQRLLERCPWLNWKCWQIDELMVYALGNKFDFPHYAHDGKGRCIILCGHILADDVEQRSGGKEGDSHHTDDALLNSLFNLWLKKGKESLCGLNGRYTLITWDKKEQELNVATDAFGSRHMYYLQSNGHISFSTNLSILTCSPHFRRALDPQGVVESLCLGYQLEDRTLFEGIKLVPPSSLLVFKRGHLRVSENKRFTGLYPRPDLTWKEAIEEVHFLLQDSLKKRARDNVEYIIPLSGGLDSRCLTGLTHQLNLKTKFYTYGVKGCKDIQIAPRVASAINSTTEIILNKPDYILRRWDDPFLLNGALRAPSISVFIDFLEQIGHDKGVFISGFLGDTITDSNRILKQNDSLLNIYTTYEPFFLPEDLISLLKIPSLFDLASEIQFSLAKLRNGFDGPDYVKDIMLNLVTRQRRFFSFQLRFIEYYGELIVPFEDVKVWEFFLRLPLMALDNKELYKRFQCRYFPKLSKIPSVQYGPLLPTAKYVLLSSLQSYFKHFNTKYFKDTFKIPSFLAKSHHVLPINHGEAIRHNEAQLARMIFDNQDVMGHIFDLGRVQELIDIHMRGDDSRTWKILAVLHILSGLLVCSNKRPNSA